MKDDKDYWFALKPYIYVEFNLGEHVLLYNTENGDYLEFSLPQQVRLIEMIYEPASLGVICLNNEMQKQEGVRNFIKDILQKQMGELMEIKEKEIKPIRLLPLLNLQMDVEKLKADPERDVNENTIRYLLELNIYLDTICIQKCMHCKKYYKQLPCCTSEKPGKELSYKVLEDVARQIRYSPVGRINFFSGKKENDLLIKYIEEIYTPLGVKIDYYIHYKNFNPDYTKTSFRIHLIINFPVNREYITYVFTKLEKGTYIVHFVVENEDEYEQAALLIDDFRIESYRFQPFYSGNNVDFFEKNVYLEKKDIFSASLSLREIFRNQKLNANFFGRLYIFPDGNVKAHPHCKSLGNIKENKLLRFIGREMKINTAWRKTRNMQPCISCIYRNICPPLSTYEQAIGKSNLCKLKTI